VKLSRTALRGGKDSNVFSLPDRGFGSFDLRHRPSRIARNPKTGEAVNLSAKVALHFKPGKEMRNKVNATQINSLAKKINIWYG
jgi:nucleoid DNA-binding protein